jgi:hypothetical protein
MAKHGVRDGDRLLMWYRSHGRDNVRDVQLYLARLAMAAHWDCGSANAAIIIGDAMRQVSGGRRRCQPSPLCMRTEDAQELRARAAAWLRAGIMEAVWRYGLAEAEPESEIPADRQNDCQDMTAPRAYILARCPAITGSNNSDGPLDCGSQLLQLLQALWMMGCASSQVID